MANSTLLLNEASTIQKEPRLRDFKEGNHLPPDPQEAHGDPGDGAD